MGGIFVGDMQIPEILHHSADAHVQGEHPFPVLLHQACNSLVGGLKEMPGTVGVLGKYGDDAVKFLHKINLPEAFALFS